MTGISKFRPKSLIEDFTDQNLYLQMLKNIYQYFLLRIRKKKQVWELKNQMVAKVVEDLQKN